MNVSEIDIPQKFPFVFYVMLLI